MFEDNLESKDSITILIHIDDVFIYYISNTFTPEGDLFNESFQPIFKSGFDVNKHDLIILNRWKRSYLNHMINLLVGTEHMLTEVWLKMVFIYGKWNLEISILMRGILINVT